MSLEEAKNIQQYNLEYLNIIGKGNKNVEQRKTLANINILYSARNNAIKFIEDYGSMILEAKKLAKEQEGTGLKILTPNQMLIKQNSKTSEHHVLVLKLTDKLDLRRGQKTVALSNLSIYYTWKNIKSSYNNNKFKISAPTWSKEFELPDGSYSETDIQEDYFEYILKKHGESADNSSIRMYINRIENRITFKIKNGYYLKLLTPETMKLLGSTESKITKDKNSENVPHLEIVELVLVHCILVNNDYQQDSRILYTFVPNKTFGSLLEISPTNQVFFENV